MYFKDKILEKNLDYYVFSENLNTAALPVYTRGPKFSISQIAC